MTIKTISDTDLSSFNSTDYPWCVVTTDGHIYYQQEDLKDYQTEMLTLGITVDDNCNIVIQQTS